jgi:acylphosphatase
MPRAKKPGPVIARRYVITGRVQGVGYRYFAEGLAEELGLAGYTRNLDDGSVEVYALGTSDQLAELSGYLWRGPRGADVRGVQEMDAPVQDLTDFRIEYFS